MKQTAKQIRDRLEAIHNLVSGDIGFDAEQVTYGEKKLDGELFKDMAQLITDIYCISHGGVSECCPGSYQELVDKALSLDM